MNNNEVPPILARKVYGAASVFTPESLLREARRQKAAAMELVPEICLLDPDGDIVTNITWSTDRDGVIGTGSDINHTFTTPGVRVLTVTAADPEGATSNTTATFEVVNTPPDVNVVRPRTNETVTRGVGFVLLGSALDPNEGKLDCTKLRWKSSNSSDPMPSNNCPDSNGLVRVKFASVGQRTITLTGTDSLGANTSVSVVVTVEDNGKPSVTILEPEELQKLGTAGKFPPVAAKAFLEDPDTDTLTYIWQWVGSSGTVVNDITRTVSGAKNGVTINDTLSSCDTKIGPSVFGKIRLSVKDETNTVIDERNISCPSQLPR